MTSDDRDHQRVDFLFDFLRPGEAFFIVRVASKKVPLGLVFH